MVGHTPKQFPRLVTEHYLSFSLIILCFNLDTKKKEMVGKCGSDMRGEASAPPPNSPNLELSLFYFTHLLHLFYI